MMLKLYMAISVPIYEQSMLKIHLSITSGIAK